ncbi:MAG TPA: DUF6498-containing protein [archaeon]|nr:DUF6498-containing protein [archaeon]
MILPVFSMKVHSISNSLSFGLYDDIRKDPTALSLLFSNLFVIFVAVLVNWNLMELLWVYWGQSVIIGIFNFLKIIKVYFPHNKEYVFINALYFLVHYNFFLLGYLLFLVVLSFIPDVFVSLGQINFLNFFPVFLITMGIFFINHLFSFLYYSKKVQNYSFDKPDLVIARLEFRPYVRIIPMHLTLLFGSFSVLLGFNSVVIFFLLLKTFADLKMHISEHKEDF